VGSGIGALVGAAVGNGIGAKEGEAVGDCVGEGDGGLVWNDGALVGPRGGIPKGELVGTSSTLEALVAALCLLLVAFHDTTATPIHKTEVTATATATAS